MGNVAGEITTQQEEDDESSLEPPNGEWFYGTTRRRRRGWGELIARRCLEEAFGNPSDRTVSLAPPLTVAVIASWLLGRRKLSELVVISENSSASPTWSRHTLRRCLQALFTGIALIVMVLLVLRIDQEQQRHVRIGLTQGLQADEGTEESVRWLNSALAAAWSPLARGRRWSPGRGSGLGAELAAIAAASLSGAYGDVVTVIVDNVTLGETPPTLDAFRRPSQKTAWTLVSALKARKAAARGDRSNGTVQALDNRLVLVEADLGWAADYRFEMMVRASTTSTGLGPQLRMRFADLVLGPVAVAIALEAAPQGYPYVGLAALTFVGIPPVDFSVTAVGVLGGAVTAMPLVREALTASLANSVPRAEEEEAIVFDLGEYLVPGSRAERERFHAERAAGADRQKAEAAAVASTWIAVPGAPRWVSWLLQRVSGAHIKVRNKEGVLNKQAAKVLGCVQEAVVEAFNA